MDSPIAAFPRRAKDAAALPASYPVVETNISSLCPIGCERFGNCNELTGECVCPLSRKGAACEEPTMPMCRTSGTHSGDARATEEEINLSVLVSDSFWQRLKHKPPTSALRRSPPFRWIGAVTCGTLPAL